MTRLLAYVVLLGIVSCGSKKAAKADSTNKASLGSTLSAVVEPTAQLPTDATVAQAVPNDAEQQATAGESATGQTTAYPEGHAKMLAILRQIKDQAPEKHVYYGRGLLKKERSYYEGLAPNSHPPYRLNIIRRLGYAELNFEPTPQLAIKHLTEAYDLLPSIDFPDANAQSLSSLDVKFYLAMAYLRLGESENCCLRHTAESCILPIQGAGVHSKQEGSRKSIKYFLEVLQEADGSSHRSEYFEQARWLLNIAYMTLDEYPDQVPKKYLIPPEFFQSEVEFPSFENVGPKLGLNTFNHAGSAVVDDFDGDHYLDIFTASSGPSMQTRFFRNNRDGTFTDQTAAAGLTGLFGGLNMVQADFNNDGNLDVYILRGAWFGALGAQHPNSLLRNNGNGTFTDVTFEAGLGDVHYPAKTAAWADYDNDGDLDLYVANEASYDIRSPCQLFRNNGDETFTDVAAAAGVQVRTYAMAAVWGDFNNDRFPDLLVAGSGHKLFQNKGDGTFVDVAETSGVTRPEAPFPSWFWDFNNDGSLDIYISSSSAQIGLLSLYAVSDRTTTLDLIVGGVGCLVLGLVASIGLCVVLSHFELGTQESMWMPALFAALYNRFGKWPLVVLVFASFVVPVLCLGVNQKYDSSGKDGFIEVDSKHKVLERDFPTKRFELPALYQGDGHGGFIDVAEEQNLTYPTEPMGANFGDLNGDGYLDFYLATGDVAYTELRPNVMFLNQRGERFANVTMGGGFGHLQKGHGVSFVDIDNDGDQDVYVQMGGQLTGDKYNDALFENPGFGHHWINVKLIGKKSNRSAIGAHIRVEITEDGKQRFIHRDVNSGGSFGCNPLQQNIGLGKAESIKAIEVFWPTSNSTETFRDVIMDQHIQITEGENRYTTIRLNKYKLGGG